MNDWKVTSTQQPFSNQWLSLSIDNLTSPQNQSSAYTYITRKHPGVVIIPHLVETDEFLLIAQYRPPIQKNIWQFPAGGVEPDSTPKKTAQTELLEETGYKAVNLVSLGIIYPDPGIMANLGHIFLADQITPPSSNWKLTDLDVTSVKKVTRSDLDSLIKSGEIRDGWTLSAYQLFNIHNAKK